MTQMQERRQVINTTKDTRVEKLPINEVQTEKSKHLNKGNDKSGLDTWR